MIIAMSESKHTLIDTSDEACAVACMLVSNPQGALRKDGDGWQRRVNDLIRALLDERNRLRTQNAVVPDMLAALKLVEAFAKADEAAGDDNLWTEHFPEVIEIVRAAIARASPPPTEGEAQ